MKKITLFFYILFLVNSVSQAQSVTLSATTANPTKGTVVYNNGSNQLQYWNGSAWVSLTNTSGAGWALSGNNLYKTNAGNVGIGTSTPSKPFTIRANEIGLSQESLDGKTSIGFFTSNGSAYLQTHLDNDLHFSTNNAAAQLTLQKGTGNFGIDTDKPVNKLQIGETSFGYKDYHLAIGNTSESTGFIQESNYFTISSSSNILLKPNGGNTGRVGINTSSPRGPLDVTGQVTTSTMPMAYFYRKETDGQHVVSNSPALAAPISIYAGQGVLSTIFVAVSDARIKNIVGISNSAKDLATIRALQITDYTMKDQLQYGTQSFKKVIAQQVETVYPQAITQVTDVVPDIYTLAETVVFNETAQTLTCALAKAYDLKIGEKLQFIHPTAGIIKAEVIAVSGNRFTVKDWQHPTDKIFVYGREVNDFRSVDYEAISMLGISAIQQLAKENEELKAKNKETDRKFEQLSARLEALEGQLPKIPTGK
ncbi:tail fiber domain-containing protein [Emticicia sp. C21]|uniref:tail fiber domain-containing protein n=1 Tax=Emticicia sp. C21 TaxID=2302915 RepID=UPI000E34597E|nr:tail fiber domain-containing protein [Emticicia sp. C21]RFS16885.1 hypothetical protein D0T08_09415 [Emticicia sp. C21]